MFKYIFKRATLLLITLFVIVTITFFLMQMMPGTPSALLDQTKDMNEAERNAYYAALGFGKPALEAYGEYIGGIFTGDFGTYFSRSTQSVPSLFFDKIPYSLYITIPAFIFGTIFGLLFGFISGYYRGKWQDTIINVFVVTFVAVPSFVLAIALMIIGPSLGLPISFNDTLGMGYMLKSLILPIVVMTLGSFATLTYYVRNEVVEVLKSDYVLIGRAKGNSETRIFFKYVLRNSAIPIVSIVLPSFVWIFSGSLIIEQFFAVPGTSTIIVSAVKQKEIYVVMFSVLFYSFISLVTQLLVDVLYVIFDPRIRLAEASSVSYFNKLKGYLFRKREAHIKGVNVGKVGEND